MKRLPTPSMMNDYYAASPRIFPHLCSLCNVECSHLKDWIQHQNTSNHIESCRQLRQQKEVYTSDFEKEEAEIINPETELSTSDSVFIEEGNIKGILEDSPLPGISTGDEQAVSTKGISEKSNMDEKEENELNTKETRMDLQMGIEKAEKNDDRMVAENSKSSIKAEKKLSAKELGLLKPTSARGGSGRISALQGKDSKLDYRDITKQSQETEAKPSVMKRDDSNNKKKKGKISAPRMVEGELSFVTLDEIGEEEDAAAPLAQALVTVDEVIDEEEITMEEMERLVTVDEIGEVEELPLNESTDISFGTLVTVDEIQDDSSDLHLVTLDEVTEEDEDSLADFNNLKEELNFVTVDEVGEEEDGDSDLKVELAQSRINESIMEEDLKTMIERHLAAKVPTKRVRIGKTPPSEKAVMAEPVKGEEAFQISEVDEESELKDSEPERKRKKIEDDSLGKSMASDVPEDLDFLVPKAGFFCPICSLFYSGEKAMTNHCKSTRHKQNTEKFMAKQRKEKEQNEAEERSSR
ncbi:hypothetical protein CB1_000252004 [Camelus ferus]|nr:hypothetical protein CB1_000252004 [Camelus ferus]